MNITKEFLESKGATIESWQVQDGMLTTTEIVDGEPVNTEVPNMLTRSITQVKVFGQTFTGHAYFPGQEYNPELHDEISFKEVAEQLKPYFAFAEAANEG